MGKRDKKSTSFNNPFEALKGLSVSGPAPPAAPVAKGPKPAPPVAGEEPEPSFDEAMQQLGVRRIEAGNEPERPLPNPSPGGSAAAEPGRPAGGPRHGRRLKQVAQGRLHPEAELDLHGMTVAQALPKVEWFIDNALFHGCAVVRLITGRGKSSPAETPVLKPQVEALLGSSLREKVLEWGDAPPHLGGAGALIVCLDVPEMGEGE